MYRINGFYDLKQTNITDVRFGSSLNKLVKVYTANEEGEFVSENKGRVLENTVMNTIWIKL